MKNKEDKKRLDKVMEKIVKDLQKNAMPYDSYVYEPKATHQIIREYIKKK